ncbi:MAG: tagaturonate reductase [Oscillospiraceae bacterium]|nr:tagaturonate reductase [Oscillospiraceae bacterium]
MEQINIIDTGTVKPKRPIKAIQFGEGNFLRAFVDYMIDILNEYTDTDIGITILKPIPYGTLDRFRAQDSIYTVYLRGLCDGKETKIRRVITSVDNVFGCTEDYEQYAALAKLDDLRFVISNTTEAGIVLDENDRLDMCPPQSFPGKLTKFLFERYQHFHGDTSKGLVMLPVELIDNNGKELKRCVHALADLWQLGDEFSKWLDTACVFTSTLVDRIVTGFPRDEAESIYEELGYRDELLVTGEPFALWVIESDKDISGELPFHKADLPVIFTDDHRPYKQRKVRILNGAHTSFVLASFLAGNDYVGQSMEDEDIFSFMHKTIFDEVIPGLDLPKSDLISFAESVIDRFKNPFIKHALLSISLNSVSKWRARCMPSLIKYIEVTHRIPNCLAFSLAALIAFYSGSEIRDGALIGHRGDEEYQIRDDKAVLEFFSQNSSLDADALTHAVLSEKSFWGEDLTDRPGLEAVIAMMLEDIRTEGIRAALKKTI